MKNLLKNLLLALLFVISTNAFAGDEQFLLTVKDGKEKSVVFFIKAGQPVDVRIFAANGELLFEEAVSAVEARRRVYNLNDFPNGEYIIKVENESQTSIYDVSIKDDKTFVSKAVVKDKFKPVLSKNDKVVSLKFGNTQGPIEVKIFDEHNTELFTKIYNAKSNLNAKFFVGKTDSKELTFVVRADDQEYIQTFIL